MKIPVSRGKILAVILIAVLGAGAATYLQKPDFGMKDRGDWKSVEGDKVTVETTYWINNSNPIGLNISRVDLNYRLMLADVKLAEGSKDSIVMKKGYQTGQIESTLLTSNIPEWWARHIRSDEKSSLAVPLKIRLDLNMFKPEFTVTPYTDTVKTNIESILNSAVSQLKGTYEGYSVGSGLDLLEPKIIIEDASASWAGVDTQTTNLNIRLKIRNPNSYPLPLSGLAGQLEMNQVKVADWGTESTSIVSGNRVIAPGETQEAVVQVKVNNSKVQEWLLTHIKNDEQTDATLTIQTVFTVNNVEIRAPREGMKCRFSFRTGILVDNQSSSSNFAGCEKPLSGSNNGSTGSGDDGLLENNTSGSSNDSTNDSTSGGDDSSLPLL